MQPKRKAVLSEGLRSLRGVAARREAALWFAGILVALRETALR
jgi:hypothetical protein